MSRGSIPVVLMMAMALPGTARALGLGELRVTSALNDPLTAQIDIIGANPTELAALNAKLADREVFRQFGADRPAFLSSTTFKVGTGVDGRAVLIVRSTEAFTEPLINLLINLNWGTGALIREYSILLDPANTQTPIVPAAIPPAMTAVPRTTAENSTEPAAQPRAIDLPAAQSGTHLVIAGDTLQTISLHAAHHRKRDVARTMIAIYHANPGAFGGNINHLKRGVTLLIPTAADVAAIAPRDAANEVREQMQSWRVNELNAGRHSAPMAVAVARSVRAPVPVARPSAEAATLTSRIQTLEHALGEVRTQLLARNTAIDALKRQIPVEAAPVRAMTVAPAAPVPQAAPAPEAIHQITPTLAAVAPSVNAATKRIAPIALGMVLIITCLALLRRRRPAAVVAPSEIVPAATEAADVAVQLPQAVVMSVTETTAIDEASMASAVSNAVAANSGGSTAANLPSTPTTGGVKLANALEETQEIDASLEDSLVRDARTLDPDLTTMILDTRKTTERSLETTKLDYDLTVLDPEATSQHVSMPSNLTDRTEFTERRTNIAQVLKSAFDRDPTRRDLLMKLLEVYHREAATNQRAFLDVVRQVSRQRDFLSSADWDQVVHMGREIAATDPLFTADADDTMAKRA